MKLRKITTTFFGLTTYLFAFLFSPNKVQAQVVFTDDFSNGFEKWEDVRNHFDIWSIVTESIKINDQNNIVNSPLESQTSNYIADALVKSASTLGELVPKDIFWDPNWKNYIYKLDYTHINGVDNNISFWFQDVMNWYQIHFVGGSYYLSHIAHGEAVWTQSGSINLESNITHRMEIHLNNGNIKLFIDNVFQFEYFDPTFDNDFGKIGLKAGAGAVYPTHVQFDNIEVSLLNEDIILPVTPIKQTDPTWKDIEYDSATQWSNSNSSIGDWGCLISSISMVINYHGIHKFTPNIGAEFAGQDINPATLNAWLIKQEDGFIGPGLVNWSAITRLVKEIGNEAGSVSLEYTSVHEDKIEIAQQDIVNNIPVILEIPGHFFVGNGYSHTLNDIFIVDPAYSYERLGQHQANVASTRRLIPSHTDLSYIHLSHDNSILVEITNFDGSPIDNYKKTDHLLEGYLSKTYSPLTVLHEISKPNSGKYKLTITSNTGKPELFVLKIYTYDENANLTNLTYSGVASPKENQSVITLNFEKSTKSTKKSNISFDHLLADITQFENSNDITKHYVAFELKRLTMFAIESENENKDSYIFAINKTLSWYKNMISEYAYEIMTKRIIEISG